MVLKRIFPFVGQQNEISRNFRNSFRVHVLGKVRVSNGLLVAITLFTHFFLLFPPIFRSAEARNPGGACARGPHPGARGFSSFFFSHRFPFPFSCPLPSPFSSNFTKNGQKRAHVRPNSEIGTKCRLGQNCTRNPAHFPPSGA